MAKGKFIAYLRVSTARQGRSGLGLEAQRKSVADYLNGAAHKLLAEYVEVESGKRADRPKLAGALQHAKATGATLVIAKLDRLSRNAAFLLNLQEAGVDFVAADMPQANRLTVGILALVAQEEREAISRRTREALAAAKARGKKLGNPNGARALQRHVRKHGNSAAVAAVRGQAQRSAEALRWAVERAVAAGAATHSAIAAALNEARIETPRGGRWHARSVARLRERLSM